MGILNSYNYFIMPALASAFFNIVLIAGCILGPYYYQNMGLIEFMGIVVVLGGIAQFVVQLPQARHIQFFPPLQVSPFHPRVKEFLIKMAPGVFGLAVYQINALITQMYFASKWDGGISIMTYAFRFIQLPLGVVGVALAAASFPRISQQIEQDRHADAAKTLMKVLKYLMVLMIPASVGLMVLGKDIIGLIYNRMEFQKANWLEPTYMVMIFYAFGLFFYSLLKVLVRVIQAHHDFTTPVKIGAVSLVVNIVLCSLFSRFLPLWSLALASALASAVQGALLLVVVVRRMPDFSLSRVLAFSVRVLVAVGGMGLACLAFVQYCPVTGGTTMSHLFRVVVGMGGGMVVYAGLGWILFRQEMESVLKLK
jgi:putative peptidoglycan lipid II flippase